MVPPRGASPGGIEPPTRGVVEPGEAYLPSPGKAIPPAAHLCEAHIMNAASTPTTTRRLRFRAPNREWRRTPGGGWSSIPWTPSGVARVESSGGFFTRTGHEMSPEGRQACHPIDEVIPPYRKNVPVRHTGIQRYISALVSSDDLMRELLQGVVE